MGANVNSIDRSCNNTTPLHKAAMEGDNNVLIVRELIASGASVDAVDANGRTPLHSALANHRNLSVFKVVF